MMSDPRHAMVFECSENDVLCDPVQGLVSREVLGLKVISEDLSE